MQRVLIIGCSAAGKSTLARQLAELTGLPVIHLDREFWLPGWQEPPKEAWHARVEELLERPEWIMDGNFRRSLGRRLSFADTVIFLDFPRNLCIRRCLWRVARWYGRTRPDLHPGCPERFDLEFLRYIWRFNIEYRPKILTGLESFSGTLVTLTTPREVKDFLASYPASLPAAQ